MTLGHFEGVVLMELLASQTRVVSHPPKHKLNIKEQEVILSPCHGGQKWPAHIVYSQRYMPFSKKHLGALRPRKLGNEARAWRQKVVDKLVENVCQ